MREKLPSSPPRKYMSPSPPFKKKKVKASPAFLSLPERALKNSQPPKNTWAPERSMGRQ